MGSRANEVVRILGVVLPANINNNVKQISKHVYPLYAALCCGWVVMAGKGTDALVEAKEHLSQYEIDFT